MARGDRRAACVVGLGLVLALVAALSWLGRGSERPPGPSGPEASVRDASAGRAAAAAAAAHEGAPTVADAVQRESMPGGPTQIAGVVRLASGLGLPGIRVQLHALDAKPRPSPRLLDLDAGPLSPKVVPTATAADGTFTFDGLEPGRFRVEVVGLAAAPVECTLAAAERREVAFVVDGVFVEATVLHAAAAMPFARCDVRGDDGAAHRGRADEHGMLRLVLPPGRYVVQTLSDVWPVAPLGEQTEVVPTGVERVRWRLQAGGTDLEVVVHDGAGNVAQGFTVRLDGELGANGERAVREFPGTAGRARFERIPPGTWTVAVSSPEFVAPAPRSFVSGRAVPQERLEFVVAPGVVVPLVLQRPDGTTLPVDPELLPWLHTTGGGVACVALPPVDTVGLPRRVGYHGVPPGPATLTLADRERPDGIEYLPFDPVGAQRLDVVRGAPTPLVVVVTPRAAVDLRGCSAGGREDPAARVRVFAGAREVHGRPRQPPQRWFGWLPAGDYRVVVECGDATHEHPLRVDRGDVTLRLRP